MLQTVAAVAGGLVITEVTLRTARVVGRKVGPKLDAAKEKLTAKREALAKKAEIRAEQRKAKKLVAACRKVEKLEETMAKAREDVSKAQEEYLAKFLDDMDEADVGLPQNDKEEG